MATASRLFLLGILWLMASSATAAPATGAATQPPLAQSALLIVHATVTGDWLSLNIARTGTLSPLITKDLSVSVACHKVQVLNLGNGNYSIPVRQLGSSTHPVLDITVGHDGIREVLSGKLSLAAAPAASSDGLLGGHKQALWWVLNIGLVFAAAIFLARRKPPSAS